MVEQGVTRAYHVGRQSAPANSWRSDIQGLRGLSIMAVVLYHADIGVPGGFIGVDAFFVISGFVITQMILRRKVRSGEFSLLAFFLYRTKRLAPALLVTVVAVLLLSMLFASAITVQENTALTGVGAVFLSANVVVQFTTGSYFSPWAELNPLLHIWSLSLEEQFYLGFPLLLIAGWFLARRVCVINVVVLTSSVFVLSLWFALFGASTFKGVNPAFFGFYSPVGRVWEFAAGILLAFATQRGLIISYRASWLFGVVGLLLLLVPMWIIDSSVQYPGPWTVVPVTATLLLIIAGFRSENGITRGLASRPMTYVGDRSYSWYLWHWPIIVFAFAAFPSVPAIGLMAAAVSVIPALLNFHVVEQWSRYGKWSWQTIIRRTGALGIATLAVAGFILVGTSNGWWNSNIRLAQAAVLEEHVANDTGCHIFNPIPVGEYASCLLNESGNGRPVVLVGDSNADHISDGTLVAATELNRPFSVVSASACPFIVSDVEISQRCKAYIDTTMEWLSRSPASTVIVSTAGSHYAQDNGSHLANTVDAIKILGHDVLLVKPIPYIYDDALNRGAWDPAACTSIALVDGRCRSEITVEEAAVHQGETWDGLESAALQTGTNVLDLSEQLCPEGVCDTFSEGQWKYRDFNHLTAGESRDLAPQIKQALVNME